jgi:hypothetical protein
MENGPSSSGAGDCKLQKASKTYKGLTELIKVKVEQAEQRWANQCQVCFWTIWFRSGKRSLYDKYLQAIVNIRGNKASLKDVQESVVPWRSSTPPPIRVEFGLISYKHNMIATIPSFLPH